MQRLQQILTLYIPLHHISSTNRISRYIAGIGSNVVAFNVRSVSVQTPRTLRFVPLLKCRFTPFSPTNSSRDSGRGRSETQSISRGACTKESGNGHKNNISAKNENLGCLPMADTRSEATTLGRRFPMQDDAVERVPTSGYDETWPRKGLFQRSSYAI